MVLLRGCCPLAGRLLAGEEAALDNAEPLYLQCTTREGLLHAAQGSFESQRVFDTLHGSHAR